MGSEIRKTLANNIKDDDHDLHIGVILINKLQKQPLGLTFATSEYRSRSSMDRMTDSGSVGWAFESPRDHRGRVAHVPPFFI